MNYFKKIVDWVIQSYEPEKPRLKTYKHWRDREEYNEYFIRNNRE